MIRFLFFVILLLFNSNLHASGGGDVTVSMMNFIFQLAVIVFAAKGAGVLFKKLSLPSVLGELAAGIIIGPYLLGSIGIPFFPEGIFPLHDGALPVSYELYSIATLASLLLLFLVGLETDIEMFLRYSLAGLIVGLGGIIFSFLIGAGIGMYFMDASFFTPPVLFMGVVSTATSVGITARILSERRSMDSPEGVTILAGAVVDDVIGITLLAVTLGVATAFQINPNAEIDFSLLGTIMFKALLVLFIFLGAGLYFAGKISSLIKKSGDRYSITILSLGLALLVAGIFEQAGLAMIIGAYITGLSLSKTDISYIVQETLYPIQTLFVPMFFVVMGMLVDVRVFFSLDTLAFGLLFSAGAILSKFLGCGIPPLFMGFNKYGAMRIGLGMIPRGEVALIIAGVGFSSGVLEAEMFGVVIMMTLVSTVIAPSLLNMSLKANGRGTVKEPATGKTVTMEFPFDSVLITTGVVDHIREYLSFEGFYIYMMELDCKVYQIRKDTIFIKMSHYPEKLEFVTTEEDAGFVKALVYEAVVDLFYDVEKISEKGVYGTSVRNIVSDQLCSNGINIGEILDQDCVKINLQSSTKEGAVKELAALFYKKGYITDVSEVVKEVMEREKIVSTGFKNGFACPHARVDSIYHTHLALGIKKEGIEFNSIDGNPARVIVLLLSSNKNPEHHVQILSVLAAIFANGTGMKKIMESKKPSEVVAALKKISSTKCINKENLS